MATITGTNASDPELEGTALADQIYGLGGNDILIGFGGNDTLEGGAGADQLFGSDGFDVADYDFTSQAIRVDLVAGTGVRRRGRGRPPVRDRGLGERRRSERPPRRQRPGPTVLAGSGGADILTGRGGADRFVYDAQYRRQHRRRRRTASSTSAARRATRSTSAAVDANAQRAATRRSQFIGQGRLHRQPARCAGSSRTAIPSSRPTRDDDAVRRGNADRARPAGLACRPATSSCRLPPARP